MSVDQLGQAAWTGLSLPPSIAAIEAVDIHKNYGRRPVLRGVDLRVTPGRTLAVVGPNGAGKTTLLRILATLARPSQGELRVHGVDARTDPVAARRHVGVVMASTYLYDELTGAENLEHYSRLYGLSDGARRARDLAQLVGLDGRLNDRVATYSRGLAQRLSIARAMLHRPPIMLLDEPDSGLDPSATRELGQLLRADGAVARAIVFTCHDLQLVLTLADDVGVLVNGRFVYAAPVALLTPEGLNQIFAVCSGSDGAPR